MNPAKSTFPQQTGTSTAPSSKPRGKEYSSLTKSEVSKSGTYISSSTNVSYTGDTTLSNRKKTKKNQACYRLARVKASVGKRRGDDGVL